MNTLGELERVFIAAIAMDQERQQAYVQSLEAQSPHLADQLARLLGAHRQVERADHVAARYPSAADDAGAVAGRDARGPHQASLAPGAQVATFRIVRLVGGGTAAEVYEAARLGPMQQRVALKILRPGMGSPDLLARFEDERELLAQLDHPGIAAVLDAGVTAEGRPWFAMPFVDGMPLTRYCDRQRLNVPARLGLLRAVCEAVAYTHRRGIVHRDLTPANILVTELDGAARPVVVDFGIAKAMSAPRRVNSELHAHRKILGTPPYMAPEQTRPGTPAGPPADVFSLAAVLCELLAGAPPLDPRELDQLPIDEVYQRVRTQERPHMSAVLERAAAMDSAGCAEIAELRSSTASELAAFLRGEIAWILRRSLSLDPDQRYASAGELAAELDRLARQEPLSVGPESRLYLARKFVRRHRGAVAATAAVAATLVLATGVSMWFAANARAAQARTEQALRETEKVADFQSYSFQRVSMEEAGRMLAADMEERLESGLQAIGAPEPRRRAAAEALREYLSVISPTAAATALIRRTILDPSLRAVDEELAEQPLVEAQLKQSLATALRDMGFLEEAIALQTRALHLYREHTSQGDPRLLLALEKMAAAFMHARRAAEAEPYLRAIVESHQRRAPDRPESAIKAQLDLALALLKQGRDGDAQRVTQAAYERAERELGPDHRLTLSGIHYLGSLARRSGDYDRAIELLRKVLDGCERLGGPRDPDALVMLMEVGYVYEVMEQPKEAESWYRRAWEHRREVYGADHWMTISAGNSLAWAYMAQGSLDEALRLRLQMTELFLRRGGRLNEHIRITVKATAELFQRLDEERPGQGYAAKAVQWTALLQEWERHPERAPPMPER